MIVHPITVIVHPITVIVHPITVIVHPITVIVHPITVIVKIAKIDKFSIKNKSINQILQNYIK